MYSLWVTRFLLPSAILLLMMLVWWIQMRSSRRRLEELERERERVHAELEEALARERLELWPPPNVIRLARWRKDLDRMHREEQERPPT